MSNRKHAFRQTLLLSSDSSEGLIDSRRKTKARTNQDRQKKEHLLTHKSLNLKMEVWGANSPGDFRASYAKTTIYVDLTDLP